MSYELPLSNIKSLRHYQRNASGKESIEVASILMPAKGLSVETVSDSSRIDTTTLRCIVKNIGDRFVSLESPQRLSGYAFE